MYNLFFAGDIIRKIILVVQFMVHTCLLVGGLVQAQQLPTESSHFKVNRIEQIIDVNEDLRSEQRILIEREALSVQGVLIIGKYSKSFDKESVTFNIDEAYTLKVDGRKIPVSDDQIQKQRGVAATGTQASMPNVEVVQVTFPDVQVGDRTVIRTTEHIFKRSLSGIYSYFDFLPPTVSIDSLKIKLTAPDRVKVYVQGKPDVFSEVKNQGRTTWIYEAKSVASSIDDDAKDSFQVWPYIAASSVQTYEEIAVAYANQSKDKVKVTPAVQKLSDELIQGQADVQGKVEAIYDWVRHNVRYVAVNLGDGSWVPHDPDWILDQHYGDCKDHVLLMQVLLKAAGIDAMPALINSNNVYTFPKLPVTGIFDHVLIYVPMLDIFLDPTAMNSPYGELPFVDQDKPVAVARGGGVAVIKRTPAESAARNSAAIHSVWRIHANGDATVDVDVSVNGTSAVRWQDWLERISDSTRADAATKILRESGYRGKAELSYPKVHRKTLHQTLQIKSNIKDFLNDTEAGTVLVHPRFSYLGEYIGPGFGHSATSRIYSKTCLSVTRTEDFEIIFDPDFMITRIPKGVKIEGVDGISFISNYHLHRNIIKGNRTLILNHPSNICSPEDYIRRKPTLDLITQHLRKVVLYQSNSK